ncbi:MAG TPA: alpha/beta fold hydrolase [Candidatus Limnocylindrales bacterium]|nr:alpha/beta fold hydrolase [Candidatus Limnocylindrales bacterium]
MSGSSVIHEHYRALLDRWPVPSEQLTVPTRLGETFVVASGPAGAPPLVLLHGSGSTSAMWLGDISSYVDNHRVYAVDIPGEPGLSAPARPTLASGAYADWLGDVLDALGIQRVRLLGLSLGGWLAADFATRDPDRVERLVLLSPSGIGRQKLGIALLTLLLVPLGRYGRRLSLRLVLGTTPPRVMADFVLVIHKHFRARREIVPRLGDEALAALTMPVLAIVGGRDALLDSAGTRDRLSRHAPGAEVIFLPGAGHLLPSQSGRIAEFLGGFRK